MSKIILVFFLIPFFSFAEIKVLTYSSLLDKGGLGEEIQKQAVGKISKISFESSKDFSGVLGTLRRLKREGKLSTLDVVLGLNESNYTAALKEGLVQEGKVFEESSFSLLVNKEKFPENLWPKTWKEVSNKLAGKIIIQDPRTSEVGLTWLLNASILNNISLEDAKKLPKKVFPSWSSSFEAFESGLAPVIWTYSTSAAYYACTNDAQSKKLVNLPLPSYPKDRNFIAAINSKPNKEVEAFIRLIESSELQNKIWQKNWMFPAKYPSEIKTVPECFSKVWFPADAKNLGATPAKELLKQLDQWSL